MNATLYTGNGGTQTITNGVAGQSFQPDMVWGKSRSAVENHSLYDSVRLVSSVYKALYPNLTNAETTDNGVTAFNSNGFTLGGATINTNTATYVGWQWKAGGTAVSNTSGTITSSVSANTTSGFSVVTYTGTGSAGATVGHGLGVAPSMVIVKERGNANIWAVGSSSLTSWAYYLRLNATNAASNADNAWNSTAPSSSVFTIGDITAVNRSSGTYVAYCWSQIAGFSSFGSYTGNGSTDGTFVYLGFRPRWIMVKRTDSVSGADWQISDTSENPYNQTSQTLAANDNRGSTTFAFYADILSNGFKLRGTDGGNNASGGTYIYMAFAENPFKYANARQEK